MSCEDGDVLARAASSLWHARGKIVGMSTIIASAPDYSHLSSLTRAPPRLPTHTSTSDGISGTSTDTGGANLVDQLLRLIGGSSPASLLSWPSCLSSSEREASPTSALSVGLRYSHPIHMSIVRVGRIKGSSGVCPSEAQPFARQTFASA